MNRMFAIFEREMRKFFRSPVLMIMSMMLPIVQLVILGNAYGGKIRNARVAIVDYDRGPQAVRVREACAAIAVNIATFKTVDLSNEVQAREDVRTGKIDAAFNWDWNRRACSFRHASRQDVHLHAATTRCPFVHFSTNSSLA
jgi:ABC-2 type transport system permease protein